MKHQRTYQPNNIRLCALFGLVLLLVELAYKRGKHVLLFHSFFALVGFPDNCIVLIEAGCIYLLDGPVQLTARPLRRSRRNRVDLKYSQVRIKLLFRFAYLHSMDWPIVPFLHLHKPRYHNPLPLLQLVLWFSTAIVAHYGFFLVRLVSLSLTLVRLLGFRYDIRQI